MKKDKPTMAFVDHTFHEKTKSSDFIKELLSPHFEITYYGDNSWQGGENIPVEELNKYEYVFFEQVINPLNELGKITAKIIWAPMYDGINFDYFYWKNLSFSPIKILCFSEKIYSHCLKFGMDAFKLQYFINPYGYSEYNVPKNEVVIFFWYRGSITFEGIKKIIDPKQIDRFIYKSNPDPNYKKETISAEDRRDFKMQIIEGGYSSKKEYLRLLSQANVFVAPRKKEGIGLSFLEAMAMGQCIIGNNDATMNEYVTDGDNGYLFNLENPKILNLSDIHNVIRRSKKKAFRGHSDWKDNREKIAEFINSPFGQFKPRKINRLVFSIFAKLRPYLRHDL